MVEKFVPLKKQSKKLQRAEHAKRRGSWGGIKPVTRKPINPKAYVRGKAKQETRKEFIND